MCDACAQVRRFAKPLGVRCTAVFGGVGKYEQFKELKAGSEVVVGTPGRLLELIKAKGGLSMTRVTYVVIVQPPQSDTLAQYRAAFEGNAIDGARLLERVETTASLTTMGVADHEDQRRLLAAIKELRIACGLDLPARKTRG